MVVTYQSKLLYARIATVSSIASLIAGIAILIYFDPVRHNEYIFGKLVLGPSSERTKDWIHSPAPVLVKFYFFDITNANEIDVKDHGEVVPSFVERGPYVYEEKQEKVEIAWNPNGTVSFHKNMTYHFRQDLSAGSDNDTLRLFNTLIVAIGNSYNNKWDAVDKYNYDHPEAEFSDKDGALWINHQHIIPVHQVKDIIWGHSNNISDLLHRYVGVSKNEFPEVDGLFGFAGTNNTQSKEFEIFTGADRISVLGNILQWDKSKRLGHWKSDKCHSVSVSDGQLFPPNINSNTKLRIFEPDLCRQLPLDFIEERVHEGLPVYRFGVSDLLFDPDAPAGRCYCNKASSQRCGIKGAFSISNCKQGYEGWPLLYSKPHFIHSHLFMLKGRQVAKSKRENHNSYYDIIPQLGIPVASKVRMQINVEIDKSFASFYNNGLKDGSKIKSGIYPVFWFERGYDTLPKHQLSQIKSMLEWYISLRWGVGGTMLGLFLILACVSIYLIQSTGFYLMSTKEENLDSGILFSDVDKAVEESDKKWPSITARINKNLFGSKQNSN